MTTPDLNIDRNLAEIQEFSEIPAYKTSMDAALAAMDAVHSETYARYSWQKLRHLLSVATKGHYSPTFIDTPVHPMIRDRCIDIASPTGALAETGQHNLITNTRDLGPSPKEKCSAFGRCHVPESPIFYASFNEDTVLSELRPNIGSVVYLLKCRPKPGENFRMRVIGELDYIRRNGRSSILSKENKLVFEIREWLRTAHTESDFVRIAIDAFMADVFLRRAQTPNDYKASSALSSLMLEMEGIDHPADGEALYYPSVAHQGGMNIALTRLCYENKVEPVSCKIVLVQRYFGYGIYKTHPLAETSDIDSSGNIMWPNKPYDSPSSRS